MHIRMSFKQLTNSYDRIVVSTPRCGRGNPGSNPGRSSVKHVMVEGSQNTFSGTNY